MKKLVIIFILISVSAGIFLYLRRKTSFNSSETSSLTPTAVEAQTVSPIVNITPNDWNTYESPRFNYEFSYPETWDASFWNENDPEALMGTHTFSNYDTSKIERYMDHGIVDWQKFMGNKIAIKIDLMAEKLNNGNRQEFIEKYYSEATLQPNSDLKFGDFVTVQYNTPSALSNELIRSYFAFLPDDQVIFASVFVKNQPEKVVLQDSSEWKELVEVFKTFKYTGGNN